MVSWWCYAYRRWVVLWPLTAGRHFCNEGIWGNKGEAVDNFEELSLSGGIIYANNVPVAMTIASYINDAAVDIHFEKAVGEYAVNGGFAAINQMYASTLKDVKFINREEDINIPGLRKAKESYHPKFMLKKYGMRVK